MTTAGLPFARVAACFDELGQTASRNTMVSLLAALYKEASPEEVHKIVYLSQGRLVPAFERLEFGVGEALLRDAIATAAETPLEDVRRQFVQVGDYGSLVATLLAGRPAGVVSVIEVYDGLYAVAVASGKGAQGQKKAGIADLLRRCGPQEAKHSVRIILGRLRLGTGDPTVMDALSYARTESKADRKEIERTYNLCSDLGLVASTYLRGGVEGLRSIHVQVGKPVRPALAERVAGPEELIKRLGRCAVEPKIDGFRLQVHKPDSDGGELHAYSRNLEDMSEMFPEVVEAMREQARGHTLIVEGEAVGYDPATLEFHPFQVTVQRRRKYDVDTMRQTLPLKLIAFDLLNLDGEDLTPLPYAERRRRLVDLLGAPIDFGAAGAAAGPVVQPNDVRVLE
ncbi:MAG TPA: DNA ligase, partial [Chloroflexota bacterium]|nr:DNA ligase [Chloroflexota bacterium]